MINLPAKFKEANSQDKKHPDILVAVEDVTLSDIKTTETDWGNNTGENFVDYTPSPPNSGDVELATITAEDTWEVRSTGPAKRYGAAMKQAGGLVYLFGGFDTGPVFYSDTWRYNIALNIWTQLFPGGSTPTARYGHTMEVFGPSIILFGGQGLASPFYLNDVWIYNTIGNTWTQSFPTGGPPAIRSGHSSVPYGENMYIYGGDVGGAGVYKELWKFNSSTKVWTQLSDGPVAISGHTAVVYGGKMYVHGGRDVSATINDYVWEYDIPTDVWIEKTSSGIDRYTHVAEVWEDRMYVHGGSTGTGYLKDTWEYNISLDAWTQLSDGPRDRTLACSSIGNRGKMLVFGGANTILTPVWLNNLDKYYIVPEYKAGGTITTDNLDLGEVPSNPGEWAIEDIKPDGTDLTYTAEYSTTGAWGGEEISIGAIIDGQTITDLKRYWRVTADLSPDSIASKTPTLQSIKADFSTFKRFNQVEDLGYEPIVMGISSLTSKVDFFEAASIGKISLQLAMTPAISTWLAGDTLFNKIVRVKLGYVYPELVEADYIDYFAGAVDDWGVDGEILNIQLKDLSKDWKLPVPEKWEDVGDDVVYANDHHIDVMLGIFQNEINVRDSGLLLESFATVKAATATYKVTRTITGKTEDAKKLVEELRVLLFAFFLPRGDGRIGIKQFDKTEATVASFTDDNTISITWKANAEGLINRSKLYFNWDGAGDDEENFSELDEGDDTTSQTDFRSIVPFELKDKWTRAAEASQISGLETKIFDQFSEMPSIVSIECDIKDIAYEAGDQVLVSTANAPGSGGAGITDVRFLLISKNLDFIGSKIIFEALEVAV